MTSEKSVVDNPASLQWAVRLLFAECAGLAVLTVYLIVETFTDKHPHWGTDAALVVMAALAAVCVFYVARALGQRRRGARGPAIVVQLFTIASGGFLVQVHPVWLGVVLIALGVLTGLLTVLPPSTRALGLD